MSATAGRGAVAARETLMPGVARHVGLAARGHDDRVSHCSEGPDWGVGDILLLEPLRAYVWEHGEAYFYSCETESKRSNNIILAVTASLRPSV